MKRPARLTINQAVMWLFLAAVAWFLVHRFGQLEAATTTLLAGSWVWILVAAVLQALYYFCLTSLSTISFAIVGIRRSVRELLPLVLGSLIINVLAPTGGAASAGLFMQDATARKESAAKAGSGALLSLLATYFSFVPILAVGIGYLIVQHEIKTYQIIGTALLIGLIVVIYLAFRLATERKSVLRHVFYGIDRILHAVAWTLRRPPLLRADWIETTMVELAEAGDAMKAQPLLVGRAVEFGIAGYIVNILSLAAIFLAFHQELNMGIVIAGYAISFLFWIVAPAPQGIGIEEAIMGVVLGSLGVPVAQSIAIAVAFRGVNFWLPLLVGIVLFVRHQHTKSVTAALAAAQVV